MLDTSLDMVQLTWRTNASSFFLPSLSLHIIITEYRGSTSELEARRMSLTCCLHVGVLLDLEHNHSVSIGRVFGFFRTPTPLQPSPPMLFYIRGSRECNLFRKTFPWQLFMHKKSERQTRARGMARSIIRIVIISCRKYFVRSIFVALCDYKNF